MVNAPTPRGPCCERRGRTTRATQPLTSATHGSEHGNRRLFTHLTIEENEMLRDRPEALSGAPFILGEMVNVSVRYGAVSALEEASLGVRKGWERSWSP